MFIKKRELNYILNDLERQKNFNKELKLEIDKLKHPAKFKIGDRVIIDPIGIQGHHGVIIRKYYEKKESLYEWYTGWKYEIFFDKKYSCNYKEFEITKE